ncbi:aldehyde dehydrogenase (NADP(+)) [Pandoraea pneumonica]|uniref:aldehyde dehydrogenase (NADP(+)) n=1 Tax=Pandoraea pneumonica TaxID=2508299 RepID=UPI003CF6361D
MIIGRRNVRGTQPNTFAFDPVRNVHLQPPFGSADIAQIDEACELASHAFDTFRSLPADERARFLERIAENILDLGEDLIERARAETGLSQARLVGERARTVGQLRLFASVVRDGRWLDVAVDPAMPNRQPNPRADLRRRNVPLGSVAVFGASNFPLAFSVAGGDTASAFAAGCPVVVKAHPAHPGTSELVAKAVRRAAIECGMPDGVFSMISGAAHEIGRALVMHPAIKAVGFTGSRQGGLALAALAATRKAPIPVFAEMSSINPVFVLPEALATRASLLAQGLMQSINLGVGQFCTNPGVIVLINGQPAQAFVAELTGLMREQGKQAMLAPNIAKSYRRSTHLRADAPGVSTLTSMSSPDETCIAEPALFAVSAKAFLADDSLQSEIFGPASLVVYCDSADEMLVVAEHLEGQLTCTIQMGNGDQALARELLPTLERKCGRILANDYPTGVDVCHAMVHGGPFPATTDSRFTSVGTAAIARFLRPVCYQNFPQALLPKPLQDAD